MPISASIPRYRDFSGRKQPTAGIFRSSRIGDRPSYSNGSNFRRHKLTVNTDEAGSHEGTSTYPVLVASVFPNNNEEHKPKRQRTEVVAPTTPVDVNPEQDPREIEDDDDASPFEGDGGDDDDGEDDGDDDDDDDDDDEDDDEDGDDDEDDDDDDDDDGNCACGDECLWDNDLNSPSDFEFSG